MEKLAAVYRSRTYPAHALPGKAFLKRFDVVQRTFEGRPVYIVRSKTGAPKCQLLYTHGGAYVNALRSAHWEVVAALADAANATVWVPIYPLAPEHDSDAAYGLLRAVYDAMLTAGRPKDIGDLAIGQALEYRDAGLPLPGRGCCFRPGWT